ncbi:hypothetical protein Y88_3093 [Novosphingobium nitrogenifigens DSM 19370]|uniref:Uncharacterized protein n=1 Tax=Novosphingobium nitrogenifigens DSM 19370 TaxID=983920 RepID=F1ZCF0_9SPHN|nr:hypothetical protein Y88_3093 [Novosphingobium nitrogenifigens DSM 19370]
MPFPLLPGSLQLLHDLSSRDHKPSPQGRNRMAEWKIVQSARELIHAWRVFRNALFGQERAGSCRLVR